jgi:glycerophosphoryl diester phosphodiesterase
MLPVHSRAPAVSTTRRLLTAAMLAAAVAALAWAAAPANLQAHAADTTDRKEDVPIVYGHRGASGLRPEHTLASYQLAIDSGADFIEPDLVSTKDGVLVARHENEISGTTNVADHPEFAARRTTKVIDGQRLTGWFTEDFTLAELRTLRAKERIPDIRPANTAFDGLYQVPTLQEVIDLAKAAGVGIIPETKHPTYFDSIGLSLEEPLVAALKAAGLTGAEDPVIVQSFEVGNLKQLNEMIDVRLAQLLSDEGAPADLVAAGDPRTYADMATPEGLAEIATYAEIIGPSKTQIVPEGESDDLGVPTSLVDDAHAAGLEVVPYTFRNENEFLVRDFQEGVPTHPQFRRAHGDAAAEYRLFFELGVDGVFSDFPETARVAADRFAAGKT